MNGVIFNDEYNAELRYKMNDVTPNLLSACLIMSYMSMEYVERTSEIT